MRANLAASLVSMEMASFQLLQDSPLALDFFLRRGTAKRGERAD
jgi:hypothetical protein